MVYRSRLRSIDAGSLDFFQNRHGRFRDSSVFRDLFETIVQQCVNVGLVQGARLSVDGTVIAADASSKSRVSREQLPKAAKVSRTLREYLAEVETANLTPSSENQTPPEDSGKISSSDPDATWATKGGVPAQLNYYDNYLIDNESDIILDVEATRARFFAGSGCGAHDGRASGSNVCYRAPKLGR